MAQFSHPLSANAQAAYSDLVDVVRREDLQRSIDTLSGSFSRKDVRGRIYWYYQATDVTSGGTRQIFVGPDTPEVKALVERSRGKDTKPVAQLANAAVALGCTSTPPVHFRIIRRLNETGLFAAGAVLVGSHAFISYGNMLGVRWKDHAYTKDIDFAHAGKAVSMALPQNLKLKTRENVEALESGFLPIPGFFPGDQTSSFASKSDATMRIDFLAPMTGGKEKPYLHEGLGVNLQPLRFLDIILVDVYQAAIVSSSGATLVSVPDPARYALHKLLVYSERRKRDLTKARKDLAQAGALLEILWDFRPEDLKTIWYQILEGGPGWRKRALDGAGALEKLYPDLAAVESLSELAAARTSTHVTPTASRWRRPS